MMKWNKTNETLQKEKQDNWSRMDGLRLVLNSYNGNHSIYCGRWISQNSCGDVMTDAEQDAAEQDNDGDISSIMCAIHSLSHDISTVTNEQKKQLIALCNEMRYLLLRIEGIEGWLI